MLTRDIHHAKYAILPASDVIELDDAMIPLAPVAHARCKAPGCNTILRREHLDTELCSLHERTGRRRSTFYVSSTHSNKPRRMCSGGCGRTIMANNKCGMCTACRMDSDEAERVRREAERKHCEKCGAVLGSTNKGTICSFCRVEERRANKRTNVFDAKWDVIVDEYTHGATITELAERHCIGKNTVAAILRMRKVETRQITRSLVDDAMRQAIISRYQLGRTSAELADEFGISNVTVYRVIKQAHVPLHEKRRLIDDAKVRADRAAGMPIKQIARKYNISVPGIKRSLSRSALCANTEAQSEAANVA